MNFHVYQFNKLWFTILLMSLFSITASEKVPIKVQLQWSYVNFTWPSQQAYESAVHDGSYVAVNNHLSGLKVWKDRVYITIPRLRDGVPVTLASVSLNDKNRSPLLEPYPNWDMQNVGDCSAFQFVQSMEIDPLGRMWVIDNGRSKILTPNPNNKCPPRLLIFDLENDGEVLMTYTFPEDVANRQSVYLNDIVLDHEDGGWAYITDTDFSGDPAIIVFSLRERKSWRIRDETMKANKDVNELTVNGTTLKDVKVSVNGIALSPASRKEERLVYFSPLSSKEIFTIPTSVLQSQVSNVTDAIQSLGKKPSPSDGMAMSAAGILYFGLLADDAIAMWNTNQPPFEKNQEIFVQDHDLMQFNNALTIDKHGKLWVISNRMQNFLTGTRSLNETNFRIIVAHVSSKGYQYRNNGRAPELPVICNK